MTYAAGEGHTHLVRLLLEQGVDPNIAEEGAPDGFALFSACQGNHQATAGVLLEHGANPNAGADSSGCCLTICEVYHGTRAAELQELLRGYGAITPPYQMEAGELKQALRDNQEVTRHDEFLGNVMSKCDEELLDLYLAFDPSMPEKIGFWGEVDVPDFSQRIQKLLDRGLDVNRRDWVGRTFLHGCVENFDTTIAGMLLDAGADINATDVEFRETPLAAAIRSDPWCQDEDRPTVEKNRRGMVQFLLNRGAATNSPDDESWATPLALARKRGLVEIEQILLKHGATIVDE